MSKTDKALLSRFLTYTESEVLDLFAALPSAIRSGSDYVYIPGTRTDRILLVSHADTVNQRVYGVQNTPATQPNPPNITWMGDVCSLVKFWRDDKENKKVYDSSNWGKECHALGADDRAGCAMLWQLKDMGHSVLITTGEESGLHGARAAARILKDELKRHAFAVEVDRRGDRQCVFYDIATEAFKSYVVGMMSEFDAEETDWFEALGSSTDIKHICDEIRICGVNLSAGYVGEHGGTEMLFLGAWQHTRDALKKFLKMEHGFYVLPPKPVPQTTKWHGGAGDPYPGVHWRYRWCTEHTCYMDKCHEKHSNDPATNSRVGKRYEVRIFRVGEGAEKPGEGTVELCLVLEGTKEAIDEKPTSCSNRQSKKLFKVIQHLYIKNKLNDAERQKLVSDVIDLRNKSRKAKEAITEEQLALHAAGIDPHERGEHTPSAGDLEDDDDDDDTADAVPEGYGDLAGMAVRAAVAAVERRETAQQVVHPQTSDILARVYEADKAPSAHHGQYDHATGRCWHICASCKRRWHHSRPPLPWCRLSYGCYCPDDGSPSVLQMINNSAWGYAGGDTKTGAYPEGPRPSTAVSVPVKSTERVSCLHHCYLCKHNWSHVKPETGGCKVGVLDALCPVHSLQTYNAVKNYEDTCGVFGWTHSMHNRDAKAVVEDPHTTESNEPAKSDVLVMDGKTGVGLGEPEREVGGEG